MVENRVVQNAKDIRLCEFRLIYFCYDKCLTKCDIWCYRGSENVQKEIAFSSEYGYLPMGPQSARTKRHLYVHENLRCQHYEDLLFTNFFSLPANKMLRVKMAVFWVFAPCILVEAYWRFRGAYCLNIRAIRKPRATYSPSWWYIYI
jgi:hypothetical protein